MTKKLSAKEQKERADSKWRRRMDTTYKPDHVMNTSGSVIIIMDGDWDSSWVTHVFHVLRDITWGEMVEIKNAANLAYPPKEASAGWAMFDWELPVMQEIAQERGLIKPAVWNE